MLLWLVSNDTHTHTHIRAHTHTQASNTRHKHTCTHKYRCTQKDTLHPLGTMSAVVYADKKEDAAKLSAPPKMLTRLLGIQTHQ